MNSPAFVLVHDHPSGVPEPSADDRRILAKLVEAADLMGLQLFDSVIIADGTY